MATDPFGFLSASETTLTLERPARPVFPVRNDRQRSRVWRDDWQQNKAMSRLVMEIINRRRDLRCESCGERRTREWDMTTSQTGNVARGALVCRYHFNDSDPIVLPRPWTIWIVDGRARVVQTPNIHYAIVPLRTSSSMIWRIADVHGDYVDFDEDPEVTGRHRRRFAQFSTRAAAWRLAEELATHPRGRTEDVVRQHMRWTERCLSNLEGHRCRLAPRHAGNHRWWNRNNQQMSW